MDQAVLVEHEIEGGTERIKQIRDDGIEISVAFWLKTTDDDRWYLYLALPIVDIDGITKAYRRIHAATSSKQVPWVDKFQIKLIGTREQLAKAALAQQHLIHPTIYRQPRLGELWIEEAYIYPKSQTA